MAARRASLSFRLLRSVRVLLSPAHGATPLAQRIQLRLMADLLTALLPLFAVMSVLSVLTRHEGFTAISYVDAAVLLVGTIAAWSIASRGRPRVGATLLAATTVLGALLAALNEPDPVRALPSSSFALLAVLYASFLLSPRETILFAGASLASVLVLPALHPKVDSEQIVLPAFFQLFASSLVVIAAYMRQRQLVQLERSSEASAEGARRLRVTMDSSLDAVVSVDARGRITEWSRQAEQTLGHTREEALFAELVPLCFPADARPAAAALLSDVMAAPGATRRVELEARTKDGRALPVELSAAGLFVRGQRAAAVFLRDLSERRRLQAEMVQSDRLVSVGRLAAGVAHEINNPMTYVVASLTVLQDAVRRKRAALGDDADDFEGALTDALDGAGRVQRIVKDLRAFSRNLPDAGKPVALERVVESAAHLAQHEVRHRARIVRRLEAVPPVLADESRLGQVFLNLLMNAVQAFDAQRPENEIRIELSHADGRVRGVVADNGCGMPPEVVTRLFAPFFTTKPVGEGTGLGLYLSRNLVRGFGGDIHVESAPGRGSTFTVELPAAADALVVRPERLPAATDPLACATEPPLSILVVDDDPAVLRSLERVLSRHRVVGCATGDDALAACEERSFDLALCDVMMPDMSGPELARQLVERGHVAADRIVFVSGGVYGDAARELEGRPGARLLEKPLQMERLNELLRETASRPRA